MFDTSSDDPCDTGIITKIEDDKLFIRKRDRKSCNGCAVKGICGHRDEEILTVPIQIGIEDFQSGDIVEIYISPKSRVVSALWVYASPITLLFALYGFFSRFTSLSEPMMFLCIALIVVPSYYLILKAVNKYFTKKETIEVRKK